MPQTTEKSSPQPVCSPWWDRARHEDRRPILYARAQLKSAIRQWFTQQGFIEVETACLQKSPGNETHLHAFKTEQIGTDLVAHPLYLHTSPEFACKKLLAAGEPKIFTFAPVFRNRERGPLHHPEFTMLEWYRAHAPYETVMDDCTQLLKITNALIQTDGFNWRDTHCDPSRPPHHLTVNDAFEKFAQINLAATYDENSTDREALNAQTTRQEISIGADDTWSDIFSKVLTDRIEPQLGLAQPTFLQDYPASEAALARRSAHDPSVTERFELYCCGIELANGFGELTDPHEQRRRFETAMIEKHQRYGERYPIDEDFLAALEHMPPASGVALGFDRLMMLATHANTIEDVIWTPLPATP